LLEFFLHLQSLRDEELPNLRDALERNHLLFLGGSLSDWLVRFLLRTANRDHRLSKRFCYDVLADSAAARDSSLLKFLKFFSQTKLGTPPFGPCEFATELHRRWKEANPETVRPMPRVVVDPEPTMPEGAAFISYASEDREMVRVLKSYLDAEGITVWYDRDQLKPGHDWNKEIQDNVNRCSFFIPIISRTTQRILLDAYFRKEWNLADQITLRSHGGIEFILPVLLEEIPERELAVPESFKRHQSVLAPNGVPPPEFVKRLKELFEQRKANSLRR